MREILEVGRGWLYGRGMRLGGNRLQQFGAP